MADLAAKTNDESLKKACKNLYESITKRRMYITGGIGSTVHGEAFTVDYDLPGDTVYAETCASIGLMFFMLKMLANEAKGEYADVMERAFYNTVLAGMSLSGKQFFYVNPLEVIPGISGKAVTHRHALPQRPEWYTCACCPPNVARLISSFGKYAYTEKGETAYCNMFAAGEVTFENGVSLSCETEYPYEFVVKYNVLKGGRIAVRIPSWSEKYSLTVNGRAAQYELKDAYAYLTVCCGDEVMLTLDGEVKTVYPSSRIPALSGYAAIMRGPLVYCFEGVDNEGDVLSLRFCHKGKKSVSEDALPDGGVLLTAQGIRVHTSEKLYSLRKAEEESCILKAVPYYIWGNRGETQMRVWLPER